MFPIRDHNPSGRTPYVTIALIAINVIVFLIGWPIMDDPYRMYAIYADYALIPAQPHPLSFITSLFLHGGFMHILGNMLFLWVFGDNLEDEMGHAGFLAFYLASGVAAGLVHILFSPGSTVPTIGASGAIAGVLGGYLLLYPRARVDILVIIIIIFKIFPLPAWIVLCFWFGLQLFNALGSDPNVGGVAYWAHAGGFVAGAIMTAPIWLKLGGPNFWNRTHGAPPHPAARYGRSTIPTVRRRNSTLPRVRRRR